MVVSREELKEELWPGDTFVEFDAGLNTAVKKLRAALSESADNPRFVETVPRIGYRFVAPVSVSKDLIHKAPLVQHSGSLSKSNYVSRYSSFWGSGIAHAPGPQRHADQYSPHAGG